MKQKSMVVVDGCEVVVGWVRWWVVGRRVGLLLEWVVGWVFLSLIARFEMFWCSCWRSVCVWLTRKGKKILENPSFVLMFNLGLCSYFNFNFALCWYG